MANDKDQLINDILKLNTTAMTVTKFDANLYDFKSHAESKGWVGKVGVGFSGRAYLDEATRTMIYWDMITKSSSGMGGENMGYTSEAYTIKGAERSGSGSGSAPGGEVYNYDYGKVREQVRAIAETNGWNFKTTLIKPKWWKGLFG